MVNMAEREIIVDKMRLTYEGLLSVPELYTMIDEWFHEKGYDKRENKNIEVVTQDRIKFIELELEPWKKITDYAKNIIKMRILISDLKHVDVEIKGVKQKLTQGKVQIVFDAFLETDYESRWEGKPIFYFLRTLFDKYFYKPFTAGFETGVKQDTLDLHSRIKAFLNLYKF